MYLHRRWKPSQTERREFALKMEEIETFCREHGITRSASGDSYYFRLNGQEYRISNHTVTQSNRAAYNWIGEQIRPLYHEHGEEGLVCITAGKTRIIEIYEALAAGKNLDRRGNVRGSK